MTFVVDASLATKWLVREDDSDQADTFLIRYFEAIHALDLLLVEVGGALVRRANERLTDAATARAGLARLRRWSMSALTLHRITPDVADGATGIAIELGHPLKDCIYIAFADQLGCPLATCDVKFRDRVSDASRVRLLAELV